jgi:glyoxylase-like metal-dependent hydrolase (beta-lactamase superfamily II)
VSEPRAVAQELEEVAPGVFSWSVPDDRIGGSTSAAYAVRGDDGAYVLIDPLPLVDSELQRLEPVEAIVLTAATHQRSAWRYRARFGAPVQLPEGSRKTDEEPDGHYGAGAHLPGGLEAVHAPGPEQAHYALLLERGEGVLFCPDQLMRGPDGALMFVPAEFHEDPPETRRTVERLLELPFSVLCLDHGRALVDDPKSALRDLLAATA